MKNVKNILLGLWVMSGVVHIYAADPTASIPMVTQVAPAAEEAKTAPEKLADAPAPAEPAAPEKPAEEKPAEAAEVQGGTKPGAEGEQKTPSKFAAAIAGAAEKVGAVAQAAVTAAAPKLDAAKAGLVAAGTAVAKKTGEIKQQYNDAQKAKADAKAAEEKVATELKQAEEAAGKKFAEDHPEMLATLVNGDKSVMKAQLLLDEATSESDKANAQKKLNKAKESATESVKTMVGKKLIAAQGLIDANQLVEAKLSAAKKAADDAVAEHDKLSKELADGLPEGRKAQHALEFAVAAEKATKSQQEYESLKLQIKVSGKKEPGKYAAGLLVEREIGPLVKAAQESLDSAAKEQQEKKAKATKKEEEKQTKSANKAAAKAEKEKQTTDKIQYKSNVELVNKVKNARKDIYGRTLGRLSNAGKDITDEKQRAALETHQSIVADLMDRSTELHASLKSIQDKINELTGKPDQKTELDKLKTDQKTLYQHAADLERSTQELVSHIFPRKGPLDSKGVFDPSKLTDDVLKGLHSKALGFAKAADDLQLQTEEGKKALVGARESLDSQHFKLPIDGEHPQKIDELIHALAPEQRATFITKMRAADPADRHKALRVALAGHIEEAFKGTNPETDVYKHRLLGNMLMSLGRGELLSQDERESFSLSAEDDFTRLGHMAAFNAMSEGLDKQGKYEEAVDALRQKNALFGQKEMTEDQQGKLGRWFGVLKAVGKEAWSSYKTAGVVAGLQSALRGHTGGNEAETIGVKRIFTAQREITSQTDQLKKQVKALNKLFKDNKLKPDLLEKMLKEVGDGSSLEKVTKKYLNSLNPDIQRQVQAAYGKYLTTKTGLLQVALGAVQETRESQSSSKDKKVTEAMGDIFKKMTGLEQFGLSIPNARQIAAAGSMEEIQKIVSDGSVEKNLKGASAFGDKLTGKRSLVFMTKSPEQEHLVKQTTRAQMGKPFDPTTAFKSPTAQEKKPAAKSSGSNVPKKPQQLKAPTGQKAGGKKVQAPQRVPKPMTRVPGQKPGTPAGSTKKERRAAAVKADPKKAANAALHATMEHTPKAAKPVRVPH